METVSAGGKKAAQEIASAASEGYVNDFTMVANGDLFCLNNKTTYQNGDISSQKMVLCTDANLYLVCTNDGTFGTLVEEAA